MIIRNVKVYTEEKEFVDGEIVIQDGRIAAAGEEISGADQTILDRAGQDPRPCDNGY